MVQPHQLQVSLSTGAFPIAEHISAISYRPPGVEYATRVTVTNTSTEWVSLGVDVYVRSVCRGRRDVLEKGYMNYQEHMLTTTNVTVSTVHFGLNPGETAHQNLPKPPMGQKLRFDDVSSHSEPALLRFYGKARPVRHLFTTSRRAWFR